MVLEVVGCDVDGAGCGKPKRALQARAADLPRSAGWRRLVQGRVEAQPGHHRDRLAPGAAGGRG